MKLFVFLLIFVFFKVSANENKWIGKWQALDEWQSEFNILLKQDGTCFSDYADGDDGSWKIVDGNLEILWDSGKKDYIFSGVMGTQRLHKSKTKSYTSGIKRLSD